MEQDLEQYHERLRDLAERAGERLSTRVILVSATKLLASMKNRIFRDGKATDGSAIGSYSTEPFYASRSRFIQKGAFRPQGKAGEKANIKTKVFDVTTRKAKNVVIKKDHTERKTMYLKDGYKQFRDVQGRSTDTVNLQMKGDLNLSYTLQEQDDAIVIGFNNELQSKKRKGLEKHFKSETGTIFPATKEEKDLYSQSVVEESNLITREIFDQ